MSEIRLKLQNIWAHTGFQRYLKNTGWMFFGKIASLIIAFIATAYIARNLGPRNYGELSYAISFVSIFGFLASLGIDQVLQRDLIKFPGQRNVYLGTAISLRILTAIFAILICWIFAFFISPRDVSLILIFIISLSFIISSFHLFNYEFQSIANSKPPAIASLIVVIILNILKILVIMLDRGVIYLAILIVLESILYTLSYLYLRKKYFGNLNLLSFDRSIAYSLLKDSLPLIFASAFFAIYARIDQVMIKNMINSQGVGLYDAAVRISEMWYFIPNLIMTGFLPAIINGKALSEKEYYKRAKRLMWVIILTSIFIAIVTTLFSKYILWIVFGSSFVGALVVLNIYVWSNIGAAINSFIQQILINENYSGHISIATFYGMIVNVLLNIYLIPIYGIAGAAIATLISYFVPFLSLLFYKKSRNVIIKLFKHA